MSDIDAFFDSVEGGPSLPSRNGASNSAAAAGGVGGAGGDLSEFLSDDRVPDAPADDLLQRLRAALHTHTHALNEMRETLSDTASEAWADENYTLRLRMEPKDDVPILTMIHTDNAQFNKVTTVFAFLCEEIRNMKELARTKFYGPLTMFGHDFSVAEAAAAAAAAESGDDTPSGAPKVPLQEKLPPEQEMGSFLPLLLDLSNFISRLYSLSRNLLNQLACLFHERQKLWMTTFKFIHLDLPFQSLGELASILLTLDAIVLDNPNFVTFWTAFKRMIKYIRADPARYGMDNPIKLRLFETMLLALDRGILSGRMFENLLEMDYGLQQATAVASAGGATAATAVPSTAATLVAGNRVLYETMTAFIRSWFKRLTHGIGEANNAVETYPRIHIVECYALYALQRALFRNTIKPDKSLFTELWTLQKKVAIIPLFGRACWFPADFLGRYAPVDLKNLSPSGKQIAAVRSEILAASDETFVAKTEELYNQLAVWMVRIESDLAPSETHSISTVLNARAKLLLNGILLSNQIRNQLLSNLFLHLHLREPFRAKNIRSYAIATEMLKSIQLTYNKRSGMLAENMSHMLGQTSFTIKKLLQPLKKKLEKTKKIDDAKLDILAAINLTLELLDQPPTKPRLLLLKFTSAVAQFDGLLRDVQLDELKYQLWKLELLSGFQEIIDQNTECSFVYWISNLVPAIFQDIFNLGQDSNQVQRLAYLFAAFKDCALTLFNTNAPAAASGSSEALGAKSHALLLEYRAEILGHFTTHILNPLCREVETDLRLHIHSVVLQQANLRSSASGSGTGAGGRMKDLSKFLNLRPLHFFDTLIDIRARVTHYLDSIFYNLNTVALHDWRIYAEMRNLAHEKYGLDMTEVHLPGTAHYSEALDVLEIMRNIHIFVSRYNYNMNTQIFVERAFDQKHLNTINIYHISDSLRTHGTGIMNTTVNFTYQFLIRKFKIFSEFLFDDHIKSRLIKQMRQFKLDREKLNNRFPYEVADKFLKDIRKLGVAEDGTTFLDQFRKQITEVGNALGYVRMVRSGGLHHVSQSIKFVPELDLIPAFAESATKENLSAETQAAAKNLDQVLTDLCANFSEGTEYFSILVKIFQPVLNQESQAHLKNFYAIVPALTLNYVEKMLMHKEKLGKATGRYEASFTDDGFALGLAYILRILDQNDAFNSLHWFESVNNHIGVRTNQGNKLRASVAANSAAAERADKKGGKGDRDAAAKGAAAASSKQQEEELLAHQVSMKKLSSVQIEFDLFFYSFSGATIFFQDANVSGPSTGVEGAATEEKKQEQEPGAPAAAGADGAAPAAPAAAASSIPVPPPLDDAGGFVSSSSAPPAPPMMPGMDGTVVGVGAPPAPPPDF